MKFIPTILTLLLVAPSTADLRPVSDIRIRRSQVDVADSQKDNMIGSVSCAGTYPVVALEQVGIALGLTLLLPVLVYQHNDSYPWPEEGFQFGDYPFASLGAMLGDVTFNHPLELFEAINRVYAELTCEEYEKEGQSSLLIKGGGLFDLFDFFDSLPFKTGRIHSAFTPGYSSKSTPTPETEDSHKNKKYGSDSCAGTYAAVAVEQAGIAAGLSYLLSNLIGFLYEDPDINSTFSQVPSLVALLGDDDDSIAFDSPLALIEAINSIYAVMSCDEYEREGQFSLLIASGRFNELLLDLLCGCNGLDFKTGMGHSLGFFNSTVTPGSSSNSTPTPETEDSST